MPRARRSTRRMRPAMPTPPISSPRRRVTWTRRCGSSRRTCRKRTDRRMADIRVGVGGWTFEPWRGPFYPPGLPQKRELEYASRHLTSIEINGTYYGSQKPASFARWYDESPDGFVFALKG